MGVSELMQKDDNEIVSCDKIALASPSLSSSLRLAFFAVKLMQGAERRNGTSGGCYDQTSASASSANSCSSRHLRKMIDQHEQKSRHPMKTKGGRAETAGAADRNQHQGRRKG